MSSGLVFNPMTVKGCCAPLSALDLACELSMGGGTLSAVTSSSTSLLSPAAFTLTEWPGLLFDIFTEAVRRITRPCNTADLFCSCRHVFCCELGCGRCLTWDCIACRSLASARFASISWAAFSGQAGTRRTALHCSHEVHPALLTRTYRHTYRLSSQSEHRFVIHMCRCKLCICFLLNPRCYCIRHYICTLCLSRRILQTLRLVS